MTRLTFRYRAHSLCLLFFLALLLPLFGFKTGQGKMNVKAFMARENRSPNLFPPRPKTLPEVRGFTKSFEQAFNDHFPFRNFFLRIYSKLYIKGIGVSPHKQILLGKDGHVFLSSHIGNKHRNDALFNIFRTDEAYLQYQSRHLQSQEAFLEQLQVPVLILSVPTSPLFDFEQLPGFVQAQVDRSILEEPVQQRILNRLPEPFSKSYFLFPYEQALKADELHPLFPEKNFHWLPSRYTKLVANVIAERWGIAAYNPPGFSEFVQQDAVSDLSGFAGVKLMNRNHLGYQTSTWNTLSSRSRNPQDLYENYPDIQEAWCMVNPAQEGKLLIMGDSFTKALRFDLSRYFNEVHAVNIYHNLRQHDMSEWFDCAFNDIKPDYIVFLHHNIFRIPDELIQAYPQLVRDNNMTP